MRFVAVDWSGAKTGARGPTALWHAEAIDGRVVALQGWRSRDDLTAHLMQLAANENDVVLGMDFAFSTPRWFLEQRGLRDAPALWDLAAQDGERWLAECRPPFWGRVTGKRPVMPSYLRATDAFSVAGISPKSVFQIGGPGQVGTGSIRGWPYLAHLHGAGYAVWPFDNVNLPLIVEIYPRSMTGAVVKSSAAAREAYLRSGFPGLTAEHVALATASEDAFDAAVSAVVMSRHAEELCSLPKVNDLTSRLEGLVWRPGVYAH